MRNTIVFLVLCFTAVAAMEPERIQSAARRKNTRTTAIRRVAVRRLKDKTKTTVKDPKEPDPITASNAEPSMAPKPIYATMVPKPPPTKVPKSPTTTKVPDGAQTKPPTSPTTKPPKSSSKAPSASSNKVPKPSEATVEPMLVFAEPIDDSGAAPEPGLPAPTAAPNASTAAPTPAESSAATAYFGVVAAMSYCVALSFSLW